MGKIIVNRNAFRLDEIELEQGSMTVGRQPDNGLQLQDSSVSGQHAKIVTLFSASYVEDLGSTNGTFVNGKRIQKHALHHGDVVTIGNHQLLFESEEDAGSLPQPEHTMVLSRKDMEALMADSESNRHDPAVERSGPDDQGIGRQPSVASPHDSGTNIGTNTAKPSTSGRLEGLPLDRGSELRQTNHEISGAPSSSCGFAEDRTSADTLSRQAEPAQGKGPTKPSDRDYQTSSRKPEMGQTPRNSAQASDTPSTLHGSKTSRGDEVKKRGLRGWFVILSGITIAGFLVLGWMLLRSA